MTFFADSSVLIPVFIPGHVHHERSFRLFTSADPKTAVCAAHSLAEVYATMTRLPPKHRVGSQQAVAFLDAIEERFTLIALSPEEYSRSIHTAAALGITGGTAYDSLIAACALKARVDALYTWNVGHFLLLGDEVAKRVRTP